MYVEEKSRAHLGRMVIHRHIVVVNDPPYDNDIVSQHPYRY